MDAKVLRAEVSAALRVTVSTTLIGCGGSVIGTDGADGSAARRPVGEGGQTSATEGPGEHASSPYPLPSASAAGGDVASGTATAGTANVASAGGPSELATAGASTAAGAGQGGELASAGAPAEICGAAVDACLTLVEQQLPEPGLSEAGQACCDTVIAGFDELRLANAPCFSALDARFIRSGVRQRCCADSSTWTHAACTPWGPPVPPELSAAALRAWGWVA